MKGFNYHEVNGLEKGDESQHFQSVAGKMDELQVSECVSRFEVTALRVHLKEILKEARNLPSLRRKSRSHWRNLE